MSSLLTRQPDHEDGSNGRGLSLLCLDGGGVRGLSSLHILQRLVEQIDPVNPPKPCDCFDMICGTSTGGLIAIMLGRLKMTVTECIREYEQLSASVFTKRRHRLNWKGQLQGRFDHEALEDGIKTLLKRVSISEDELLKETDGAPQCKVFVSTMRQEISDIVNFTSYYSPTWGASMLDRVRIWEAARATSAATSFFEPCVIDGKSFVDGATGANNPIHQLWAEASSIYGDHDGGTWKLEDHLRCLVSIGTGTPSSKPFGPDMKEVAASLRAIATSAESVAQTFEREHPHLVNKGVYFRFNVTNGLQGIGLEEANRLREIEALTSNYCASPAVTKNITACATRIVCAEAVESSSWAQQAMLQFNSLPTPQTSERFDKRSMRTSRRIDVQRFTHCRAFQGWLHGAPQSLICITSETISSGDTTATFPLAAKLADHLVRTSLEGYRICYVNCFWALDKPKIFRPLAILEEYRKETNQISGGRDIVDMVLETLFHQLLRHISHTRSFLEAYAKSLPEDRAVEFREQMIATGMLTGRDIVPFLKYLIRSSRMKVLMAVDGVDYLPEKDRTAVMAHIALLSQDSHQTRILLCGASSMIEVGGAANVAVVTDFTEANECQVSLRFDELNVRKSQIAPAAAGTVEWIWQHPVYHSFISQPKGLLWICGKPGSGKSVLAKCIQRRLLESDPWGGLIGDWFYHNRRSADFIRHKSFLRSALWHFLDQSPKLFTEYFQEAYRTMDPMDSSQWTSEILVDIFKKICQGPSHVICILDAMDEAENSTVLDLLRDIVNDKRGSNASFIILSRPDIDIERRFDGIPGLMVEDENTHDIHKIIELGLGSLQQSIHSLNFGAASRLAAPRSVIRRSRFGSIAASQAREEQTIRRIRETLLSKAQGSILWVKLVLDQLDKSTRECGGATLDDMEAIVEKIPKELAQFYRQMLESLIDSKPPATVEDIRKALMWISAAGELHEVTLESLWEALALLKDGFRSETLDDIWQRQMLISTYDELWRKVYSMCGPFIEVFNPGVSVEESRLNRFKAESIVQLMHQSVRDFFSDPIAAKELHFTRSEAIDLVQRHLSHYLEVMAKDHARISELRAQKPEELVGRLSEQRLMQLAFKSTATRNVQGTLHRAIGNWALEPFSNRRDEQLLINAIESFLEFNNCYWHIGMETLNLGRLLYHACREGLVTAVKNLLSLDWLSLNKMKHPFDTILFGCIYFAASRSRSPNITVELDLPQTCDPRKRHLLNKANGLEESLGQAVWCSQPWTVQLSVTRHREGQAKRHAITFSEWCPFLDILCGGKSLAYMRKRNSESGQNQEVHSTHQDDAKKLDGTSSGLMGMALCEEDGDFIVAPMDDIENAILASLQLTRRFPTLKSPVAALTFSQR
ncbi:Intracellular membrane-associated calcium-independent phospholipase A2 gamma-like protein [Cladobotryum mycophilum]|uniref:Intracellular membrane-associated calcium-independent phospholipase A2 gamma-like protein n=1 Tax=Cladobotryum mycophilum TaxID=491253 RepID=A0ABR0SYS3_9HYPO